MSASRREPGAEEKAFLENCRPHDSPRPAVAVDLVTFTSIDAQLRVPLVLDKEMDPGNFRRKFNRMLEDGLIEHAPGKHITASKPATVYRFKRH